MWQDSIGFCNRPFCPFLAASPSLCVAKAHDSHSHSMECKHNCPLKGDRGMHKCGKKEGAHKVLCCGHDDQGYADASTSDAQFTASRGVLPVYRHRMWTVADPPVAGPVLIYEEFFKPPPQCLRPFHNLLFNLHQLKTSVEVYGYAER